MKLFLTALVSVLLFITCGNKSNKASTNEVQFMAPAEKPAAGTVGSNLEHKITGLYDIEDSTTRDVKQIKKDRQTQVPDPVATRDWDKKIIKNASLDLEVKDYDIYYTSLREKVRNLGGYIAQEEQTQSEYKIQNNLSIKVPVDQFDNAVYQLIQNIEKLNEKKITSQDVTTEFVDTKSRMESKKQVRQKYLDLLRQAKNMEEILSVQSEINGIQEEIESATGHIEYLSHSSSFSTISLTYYQVLDPSARNNDSPGFETKLGNAFRSGGAVLVDLFVGLVSIWPIFLLVFALIIIYRKTRKPEIKQTT